MFVARLHLQFGVFFSSSFLALHFTLLAVLGYVSTVVLFFFSLLLTVWFAWLLAYVDDSICYRHEAVGRKTKNPKVDTMAKSLKFSLLKLNAFASIRYTVSVHRQPISTGWFFFSSLVVSVLFLATISSSKLCTTLDSIALRSCPWFSRALKFVCLFVY